jgi:hypothetical protein
MKDRLTTLKPLLVALALFAQLALAVAAPQNTNSPTTTDAKNANVGVPYNRKCRARCEVAYSRCVHGGKNVANCRKLLRNCLRHCPQ